MTTQLERAMRLLAILMATGLSGTAGCGTDSCPNGGREIGGRCIAESGDRETELASDAGKNVQDGSTSNEATKDAGVSGKKDAGDVNDASNVSNTNSGDSGTTVCDCNIDGECLMADDLNPNNDCEICDPDVADDSFSPNEGAICHDGLFCATEGTCSGNTCIASTTCDDGLSCTVDSCDEATNKCVFEITTGCVVDGVCVDEDALDPSNSCLSCDTAASRSSYTPLANGTPCTTQDPTRVALECSSSAECGVQYCDVYDCWTVVPTGQTQCSVNGNLNSCPGVAGTNACASTTACGQDAQYPAKAERIFTRSAGAEPIVTDSHTDLVWQGTITDCGSAIDCNFSNASVHCAQLDYGGYTDWRMPTIYEMLELIAPGNLSPGTNFPDPGAPDWTAWSATSVAEDANLAWAMTYQYAGNLSQHDKVSGSFPVRCVRGATLGRSNPDRFFSQDSGGEVIVLDRATQLLWQQESISNLEWTEALAYCEGLVYGGQSDWRLPDMQELASLLDFSVPTAPMSSFPGAVAEIFWSSSHATFAADSSNAAPVYFDGGSLLVISPFPPPMTDLYSARCVRNP